MTAAARLPAWAQPKEMIDLIRLAVPVAASRASFMLMSLTDAVVLSRVRPGELPLVLNSWLLNGVVMGFGLGLVLGVSVLTAELNGTGRREETGRVFRRGLMLSILYSIGATALVIFTSEMVFPLVGFGPELSRATAETTRILAIGILGHMIGTTCSFYLEALRKPNIVTAVTMSAVAVNLVSALILVPQYGAVGVVWGTTISRFYMAAVFLVLVWRLTPAFKAAPKGPEGEAKRQNTVGLGTGIANIAEWGSFNLTFVISTTATIAIGPAMGDTVYGLAVQVMAVVFMLYVGMGTATSVRVAERYGRGEAQAVKDASRLGVVASAIGGVVIAIAIVLLQHPISVFMLNGSEVASEGAKLVPWLSAMLAAIAFVTIFDGLQGVGSMAMRAQGVVWTPTAIHVGSYVGIMLPLCWWLALHAEMGVWGVVIGVAVASLVAGVGQVVALEIASARGVRLGIPRTAGSPAPAAIH
jgi:multidrug resistance protein, MATE family